MTAEHINAHDSVYNYLVNNFLPYLSDPYFRQDAAHEIEQDERMTYCRYMAAWLPHEPYYDKIIATLARCTNEKEDADKHPLYSFLNISYSTDILIYCRVS